MSEDDVLFGYRLRCSPWPAEIGVACRLPHVGSAPLDLLPLEEARRPPGPGGAAARERRRPRMPNQLGPQLEQRILAFSLAHPGFGPRRIAAELAREKWGGLRISRTASGAACAGTGSPPAPGACSWWPATPQPTSADHGCPSRSGTSRPPDRASWSASTASSSGGCPGRRDRCGSTPRSTSPPASPGRSCTPRRATRSPAIAAPLSSRVAPELARVGWRLERGDHRQRLRVPLARVRLRARAAGDRAAHPRRAADQRPRRAPAADDPGGVLAASFARSLVPKYTALRRDLDRYLRYYNFDRAHTGRLTKGRIPGEIVYGARKLRPR